ncbi:MAG: PLP-dependent aminotransferase family protein [Clostridia bacterium]|nr:PLP-dependent aminotransferase family protein [Clostridia bacterium]
MKYQTNSKSGKPLYLQLYEQLRADIINGIYPYKSKLPSKRLIADELGISTITVEHAYALLCDEGYIEARERSGYFVIFRTADYFGSTADIPKSNLKHPHSAGGTYDFPFSVFAKTMRKIISEYGEDILTRAPNKGCTQLRSAISSYLLRSRGIDACDEQIIIGSGAEYLYSLIVKLLGKERTFALESPSYEKIEQVYFDSGVKYDLLPLGTDGIESEALAATSADVLHLSPYRSFPTGISASASKRYEYIRWSAAADRYIIEDDFESEFSVSKKPEETLFSHTEFDNVIYMNTFSKTVSPSLRVGYMVIPKHLVTAFDEKLGFYSCTVPTFEQLVLAELITSGDFERHINRVRRQKRKEIIIK